MRLNKAFTLIELLVVIAIISILAAIMFPVFSQARAAAKQTVCIVHTRQIGLAFQMYKTDYDDVWPPAVSVVPISGFSPQQPWLGYDNLNAPLSSGFTGRVDKPKVNPVRQGALDLYIKNEQVKVCPNQPGEWQLAVAYNWFHPGYASPYYFTNPAAQDNEYGPGAYLVSTDASGYLYAVGENDGAMEEPASTIVTWEHHASVPVCNFLQGYDWEDSPPTQIQALQDHFNFLHRGGTVTLWGDGHVRRMVFGQLRRRMFSVRKDIYHQ